MTLLKKAVALKEWLEKNPDNINIPNEIRNSFFKAIEDEKNKNYPPDVECFEISCVPIRDSDAKPQVIAHVYAADEDTLPAAVTLGIEKHYDVKTKLRRIL